MGEEEGKIRKEQARRRRRKVKERGRRKEGRRRVMLDAGKFGTGIDTL